LAAFLILFAIGIFPFIFSLFASFHEYDLRTASGFKFVGFANYVEALTDPTFQSSILTTLEFVGGAVSVEFFLGLILALLLNQDLKGIGIVRSVVMIPMAIAPIGVALMFKIELQQEIGIISYILKTYFNYLFLPLTDPYQALGLLIAVDAWQWIPFVALVLLAGLRSLSTEIVEAAKIDCASSLQIFRYITLPNLKYQITVILLIRTMDAFKVFDIVYILTGGGPDISTQVASYWIYKVGMRFLEIGKASALSYVLLLIIIVISNLYIKYALKRGA